MSFTETCNRIFNQAIADYHVKDDIDTPINNPYERESIENRLYLKCWIDTVQWHFEDIIRDPHIDPIEALQLEAPHRPFQSGPHGFGGTDRQLFPSEICRSECVARCPYQYGKSRLGRGPSEYPGPEKIYHMKEQAEREDATAEHRQKCQDKLHVLLEQQVDLGTAIDQLLEDIEAGRKYMKVYRQMKMYNDPSTNPVLYKKD